VLQRVAACCSVLQRVAVTYVVDFLDGRVDDFRTCGISDIESDRERKRECARECACVCVCVRESAHTRERANERESMYTFVCV